MIRSSASLGSSRACGGVRSSRTFGQVSVAAQMVQEPDDLPRVLADVVRALLELVELLDDLEGQHDLVVAEGRQGRGIVQEDARVEDEILLCH
jgi:hypothetical protein